MTRSSSKASIAGQLRIERKMTLEGRAGASIDLEGHGSVVSVIAPGAVVRGLTLRGSGRDLVALGCRRLR